MSFCCGPARVLLVPCVLFVSLTSRSAVAPGLALGVDGPVRPRYAALSGQSPLVAIGRGSERRIHHHVPPRRVGILWAGLDRVLAVLEAPGLIRVPSRSPQGQVGEGCRRRGRSVRGTRVRKAWVLGSAVLISRVWIMSPWGVGVKVRGLPLGARHEVLTAVVFQNLVARRHDVERLPVLTTRGPA